MDNLVWGLQMTVVGMGLVFGLLALLWGLLVLVLRFEGATPEPLSTGASVLAAERIASIRDEAIGAQIPLTPTVHGMDADLVAAIVVAVLTHKGVRRQEAAPVMRSYWPGSLLFASRWVASGRVRQARNWRPKGR